jgi:hypothetical protein
VDCVLSCETRVGVIDDIHFIDHARRDGLDVSNHLKWLANELPVTFIYVGVGLAERRFFAEGMTGPNAALAQTARRWTRLDVPAFENHTDTGRHHWRSLLKATERQLVLTQHRPGMLTDLGDYLFDRTTGHIGSLMTLIMRCCFKAIRTGTTMRFTTINAAAHHIGADQASLIHSFRRLEHDIGARLYQPSTRQQPMRPTQRGTALLAALRQPHIQAPHDRTRQSPCPPPPSRPCPAIARDQRETDKLMRQHRPRDTTCPRETPGQIKPSPTRRMRTYTPPAVSAFNAFRGGTAFSLADGRAIKQLRTTAL